MPSVSHPLSADAEGDVRATFTRFRKWREIAIRLRQGKHTSIGGLLKHSALIPFCIGQNTNEG